MTQALHAQGLQGPDLHALAKRARAEGDHPAAVRFWRMLLDRAPDDWAVALELKQDTRAAGQYPDNDARFRRAARSLPDADWLLHYSNLYAFHAGDLAAIDTRARRLLETSPGDVRLHAILGDVARQRRDWAGAARAFARAAALDPAEPAYARQVAMAGLYDQMTDQGWPDEGAACRIAVVNLARNAERMDEMARQLASCPAPWSRHAATEGARLPGAAVARLTGDADAPRGTLGCFLSHVAVWENLVASGAEHLLVLEDDVIPLLPPPARLGGLGLPEGWDVVWVNDRMEPATVPDGPDRLTVHPLAAVMQAMHPDNNACGTDGYLISRAGAMKLLGWIAEDGMAHDIDWRMVAYGLSQAEWEALPTRGHARNWLAPMMAAIPRPDRLRAYALFPALIRTVGVSSDREDGNRPV